jgi:hypothetical protein
MKGSKTNVVWNALKSTIFHRLGKLGVSPLPCDPTPMSKSWHDKSKVFNNQMYTHNWLYFISQASTWSVMVSNQLGSHYPWGSLHAIEYPHVGSSSHTNGTSSPCFSRWNKLTSNLKSTKKTINFQWHGYKHSHLNKNTIHWLFEVVLTPKLLLRNANMIHNPQTYGERCHQWPLLPR